MSAPQLHSVTPTRPSVCTDPPPAAVPPVSPSNAHHELQIGGEKHKDHRRVQEKEGRCAHYSAGP